MNIAIVGAGWAGAAAASQLSAQHQVTVFEAARQLGGRARCVPHSVFGHPIDNGQHLMLGAYTQTLQLMRALGLDTEQAFHRTELGIISADARYQLRAKALPAPFHMAAGLLTATGYSWSDKYKLIHLQLALQRQHWKVPAQQTVLQLLQQHQQSHTLIEHFWQPLCLAAMNTPIDIACAQLFANVLRDSLGGSRADSQMLIPKQDLSTLWASHALKHCELLLGHRVQHITPDTTGVLVDGQHFDACIVAVASYDCARLLGHLVHSAAEQTWLQHIQAIRHRPIATLYWQPRSPWLEPEPLLMLHEQPHKQHYGQWLFNHHAIPNSFADNLISVVISNADDASLLGRESLVQKTEEQLRTQTHSRSPLPAFEQHELIIEKRATFEATPTTFRPEENTFWPAIKLAGDWLLNPYPGVLEGAVRSGIKSAQAILQSQHT
ncbi:FAD-dependent oxidoreductase [Alcaligenaceae bacterium 429]|uniref:hydroxysqualene dehydroxylase HpnE n=1 Tax=Paenalcaligenes sp. Me52 TaxID=3392038 RepID=UPI001092F13F|nr:FAD-dependent oxidoreductase [Alcaligenaceae bacterium 429]